MTGGRTFAFACNGAKAPSVLKAEVLDYRSSKGPHKLRLLLPSLVWALGFIPPRVLDLLELAAYIFAADRLSSRGARDAVDYQSWGRRMHLVHRVRDFDFWNTEAVREELGAALEFATGDQSWIFEFQPGHQTDPVSLFDSEEFKAGNKDSKVLLFSGGLDSLTGTLSELSSDGSPLILVSHQSGQPMTKRTQAQLFQALANRFPERLSHYRFECGLRGVHAREESQRTRAFLYSAIGFALAQSFGSDRIVIHENGITALNMARRQDMINARASRTTHPKTLRLLAKFYSRVSERQILLETPFAWMTKTDVLSKLKLYKQSDLLTSAVSCSRTFQHSGAYTHCGICSQCVDRRFAVHAVSLDEMERGGVYAHDFLSQPVSGTEARTQLLDYVRQANEFASMNPDKFYIDRLDELTDVVEGYEDEKESEVIEKVWALCSRQGSQVLDAIKRMRDLFDNPFREIPSGSFLAMVSTRDYLRRPVELAAQDIESRLRTSIPKAFRREQPKNEPDFGDKVEAILEADFPRLRREYPAIRFALGRVIPDFSIDGSDIIIENKYVRGGTSPSKVSEGIAADLTKYPETAYKMFVIYDPGRSIIDDREFCEAFTRNDCKICVIR
jgi:7-cyano-7-deazaguanine synthase in queuosine biosynthesis